MVALDAAAKLFGMNPLHDLSKNRFSGAHFDSLAPSLLAENRKRSSYRSHRFCRATCSFSNRFSNRYALEPDDSDLEYTGTDFAADMKMMAADPETQRWWKETDPCQQPLADAAAKGKIWSDAKEVFHLQ